ncbi:MAG: response regulator transcription factor [Actinomadura sp.]
MNPIEVAIVDDSDVFRMALQRSLARFSDIRLTVEASKASELIARLAVEPVDVVLVDVRMPGIGGAELTRHLREAYPRIAPVALTISDHRDDLVELLEAGSRGYILKSASPAEIANAIRAVARAEAWVAPPMARTLIDEFGRLQALRPQKGIGAGARLSDREEMVLRELALGRTNREIAQHLHIAESTVKSHLKSILEKLGVRNRVEAALYASRRNLDNVG